MSRTITIDYSVFKTIKEQIPQNIELENIEMFEKLKNDIIGLYIHGILTESQKMNALFKLNKLIHKNIKEKEGVKDE